MNIFNRELIKDREQLKIFLKNKIENLELNTEHQKQLKEISICYLNKISNCLDNNITSEYIDIFLQFLKDLKQSLNLSKENIETLTCQINTLNSLIESIDKNTIKKNYELVEEFYSNYRPLQNSLIKNTIEIETFFTHVLDFTELSFLNTSLSGITFTETTPNINNSKTNENDSKNNSLEDVTTNFPENTLIISEAKGKIFLPYRINDLEQIQKLNMDKYTDYKQIIEEQYTIPYKKFQNFSISRFKEAFKLIRNKEHKSIKEAFDLGMELLFRTNLHPAIIAGCRNIDELDILKRNFPSILLNSTLSISFTLFASPFVVNSNFPLFLVISIILFVTSDLFTLYLIILPIFKSLSFVIFFTSIKSPVSNVPDIEPDITCKILNPNILGISFLNIIFCITNVNKEIIAIITIIVNKTFVVLYTTFCILSFFILFFFIIFIFSFFIFLFL